MALHKQVSNKQVSNKPKKVYAPNITLYPNATDKFLIQYDKKAKCYRVTHYSRWGFRGQRSIHGVKTVRRNEWTYRREFKDEIEALKFAKQKAADRNMDRAVFLLELDGDWSM